MLERGHDVRALVRPGSEKKLPVGCQPIFGNALDGSSYAGQIKPADTFVQLVGVAHPSPSKAAEFRQIDLASGKGAVEAARAAAVQHFIYVSVAQPAPVMKALHSKCARSAKTMIRQSGMNATILRPWYVLGPGHRWPYLLLPIYKLMELLPQTRARRDPPGIGYVGTDVRRHCCVPSKILRQTCVSSKSRKSASPGGFQAASAV